MESVSKRLTCIKTKHQTFHCWTRKTAFMMLRRMTDHVNGRIKVGNLGSSPLIWKRMNNYNNFTVYLRKNPEPSLTLLIDKEGNDDWEEVEIFEPALYRIAGNPI